MDSPLDFTSSSYRSVKSSKPRICGLLSAKYTAPKPAKTPETQSSLPVLQLTIFLPFDHTHYLFELSKNPLVDQADFNFDKVQVSIQQVCSAGCQHCTGSIALLCCRVDPSFTFLLFFFLPWSTQFEF